MSNYKESQISGVKWRRSFRVQIDNPYNETPRVVFYEEDCINIGDDLIKTRAGDLVVYFDPSAQIPLVNPWTGEPMTNTDNEQQFASHIEAYILLHSLYIQNATLRDNPPLQPIEPETPPE